MKPKMPTSISPPNLKREWIRRYDRLPARDSSFTIIQSWDTASKDGGQNTVCTTWWVYNKNYYLIDLLRGRFDYPTLKARAIEQFQLHKPNNILIEHAGVGTGLVQDLQKAGFPVIAV